MISPRRRFALVAAVCCVVAVSLVLGLGSARGDGGCSLAQECQGQEYQAAQALFAQLNADIAAFPPNPFTQLVTDRALDAESAYPPTPIRANDFCSSYNKFGALENFGNAHFPPVPVFTDIAAIRAASIWVFFPPVPIAPQVAACIH